VPGPKTADTMTDAESAALSELREISWGLDSPNLEVMYKSVSRLAGHPVNWCLLPKTMSLLTHTDKNVQHAAFTLAARAAFGPYVGDLFHAMQNLNPAEREQTLQSMQERFSKHGGPSGRSEQKAWVGHLETLGREHQPSVFSLMRYLGDLGLRWVTAQVRNNTKGITLGTVPVIAWFPEKQSRRLVRLLAERAAKEKRELLPFICGIVDHRTCSYLGSFLKGSSWQERAEIAGAISRVGITSTSGLVMELVGDPNWQVRQALLENLNIIESKFSSLLRILDYLTAETHARVRGLAERTLLLLGSTRCQSTAIKKQRTRLEKEFRPQLLKAANANKDLDARWLGIEPKKPDLMSEILEKVSEGVTTETASLDETTPEGVSLLDLTKNQEEAKPEPETEDRAKLLSALLGARKATTETTKPPASTGRTSSRAPPSKRFLAMLQSLSKKEGKEVPVKRLFEHAGEYSLDAEELVKTMAELEKQGLIYRSRHGTTVSYAGFEA
jgi:hypothetical protein